MLTVFLFAGLNKGDNDHNKQDEAKNDTDDGTFVEIQKYYRILGRSIQWKIVSPDRNKVNKRLSS